MEYCRDCAIKSKNQNKNFSRVFSMSYGRKKKRRQKFMPKILTEFALMISNGYWKGRVIFHDFMDLLRYKKCQRLANYGANFGTGKDWILKTG